MKTQAEYFGSFRDQMWLLDRMQLSGSVSFDVGQYRLVLVENLKKRWENIDQYRQS